MCQYQICYAIHGWNTGLFLDAGAEKEIWWRYLNDAFGSIMNTEC